MLDRRLGKEVAPLRDALSQLQMAYAREVQVGGGESGPRASAAKEAEHDGRAGQGLFKDDLLPRPAEQGQRFAGDKHKDQRHDDNDADPAGPDDEVGGAVHPPDTARDGLGDEGARGWRRRWRRNRHGSDGARETREPTFGPTAGSDKGEARGQC